MSEEGDRLMQSQREEKAARKNRRVPPRRVPDPLALLAPRGVECPECGSPASRVVKTRRGGGLVIRRRQCLQCGHRVTTFER